MANLLYLPPELLLIVLKHLPSPIDVNALSQICRYFYSIFTVELYKPLLKNPSHYNALQTAAADGNLPSVRRLLQAGVPVHSFKTPYRSTNKLEKLIDELPIRKAVIGGHLSVVLLLIEHGALSNAFVPAGSDYTPQEAKTSLELVLKTCILSAIKLGFRELLKILLKQETLSLPIFCAAFHQAVACGETEMVEVLHRRQPEFSFSSHSVFLRTATEMGYREMIALLLDKGCSPYEIEPRGKSALRIAASKDWEVFEAFLRKGVSPANDIPRLCLEAAVKGNSIVVVRYFVERQKEFRIQNRSLVKMLGDIQPAAAEMAEFMLESIPTAEIDKLVNEGTAPKRRHIFNAACIAADTELLSRLFQVDEEERNRAGILPRAVIHGKLHNACDHHMLSTVKALFGFQRIRRICGGHFSVIEKDSILCRAVERHATDIIEHILDSKLYNFSVLSKIVLSEPAKIILHTALHRGYTRLVATILANMRQPAKRVALDVRLIQGAVAGGLDMLNLVRRNGACLDTSNPGHWSALQFAIELGKTSIVSEFLKAGFDVNTRYSYFIGISPLVDTAVLGTYDDLGTIKASLDFYRRLGACIMTPFRDVPVILQLIDEVPSVCDSHRMARITTAIRYLLLWGADPFETDSSGYDLFTKSARSRHPEILKTVAGWFLERLFDNDVVRERLRRAAAIAPVKSSRWLWRAYWDKMYQWNKDGKITSIGVTEEAVPPYWDSDSELDYWDMDGSDMDYGAQGAIDSETDA